VPIDRRYQRAIGVRKGVARRAIKGPSGKARQARDNQLAKEGRVAGAF
jgi:hypothetical protein